MRFNVTKRYDTSMTLLDWVNADDDSGQDQYTPIFQDRGIIKGYVAVDPGTGNLFLELKEMLTSVLGKGIVTNVVNSKGQPISRVDFGYQLLFPIPQINPYGQIYSYRYVLSDKEL